MQHWALGHTWDIPAALGSKGSRTKLCDAEQRQPLSESGPERRLLLLCEAGLQGLRAEAWSGQGEPWPRPSPTLRDHEGL